MLKARIYHNPRCSKSRGCLQILEAQRVEIEQIRYLDATPDRQELAWLWQRLGQEMVRSGESLYRELNLAQAQPEQILQAMLENPILIERPIVILDERAVVARPPEKVHELLMERQ